MVGLKSAFFDELAEIRDSPLGSRLREVGLVLLFTILLVMDLLRSVSVQAKLAEMQKAWQSACAYEDALARGSLDLGNAEIICSENNADAFPQARQNKRWFCDAYCSGHGLERSAAESTWDLVTISSPVEALAMVACVPTLVQLFCVPESFAGRPLAKNGEAHRAVEHRIIGASATAQSASALSDFLAETLRAGVRPPPPLRLCAPHPPPASLLIVDAD